MVFPVPNFTKLVNAEHYVEIFVTELNKNMSGKYVRILFTLKV